ncbi:MAG: hypothetical protein JO131_02330 [Gammaproteobacteria bacterium]|nr:hypothetical protein [Gammaproteobacteria bacterium]
MAKIILAASTRRRNTISDIIPTFCINSCKNDTLSHLPPPNLPDLNILIGLAFTAILIQDSFVDHCRPALNFFLNNRYVINEGTEEHLITAITQILEKGFEAFKFLGFPYYFDDFIQAYYHFVNSSNSCWPLLNQKMKEILQKNIVVF